MIRWSQRKRQVLIVLVSWAQFCDIGVTFSNIPSGPFLANSRALRYPIIRSEYQEMPFSVEKSWPVQTLNDVSEHGKRAK